MARERKNHVEEDVHKEENDKYDIKEAENIENFGKWKETVKAVVVAPVKNVDIFHNIYIKIANVKDIVESENEAGFVKSVINDKNHKFNIFSSDEAIINFKTFTSDEETTNFKMFSVDERTKNYCYEINLKANV